MVLALSVNHIRLSTWFHDSGQIHWDTLTSVDCNWSGLLEARTTSQRLFRKFLAHLRINPRIITSPVLSRTVARLISLGQRSRAITRQAKPTCITPTDSQGTACTSYISRRIARRRLTAVLSPPRTAKFTSPKFARTWNIFGDRNPIRRSSPDSVPDGPRTVASLKPLL